MSTSSNLVEASRNFRKCSLRQYQGDDYSGVTSETSGEFQRDDTEKYPKKTVIFCVYDFNMIIKINSDYFSKEH